MHFYLQIHSHTYLHRLRRTHVHACLYMLSHADRPAHIHAQTHSCADSLMCMSVYNLILELTFMIAHAFTCRLTSHTCLNIFTCRLTCMITHALSHTDTLGSAGRQKAAAFRAVDGAASQWGGDGTFRPLLSIPKSTCIYPKAGTEASGAQEAPAWAHHFLLLWDRVKLRFEK